MADRDPRPGFQETPRFSPHCRGRGPHRPERRCASSYCECVCHGDPDKTRWADELMDWWPEGPRVGDPSPPRRNTPPRPVPRVSGGR